MQTKMFLRDLLRFFSILHSSRPYENIIKRSEKQILYNMMDRQLGTLRVQELRAK